MKKYSMEESRGMVEVPEGEFYKVEDVEPFIEYFGQDLELIEYLKKATFEDNVEEGTRKYLECSARHQNLRVLLRERL